MSDQIPNWQSLLTKQQNCNEPEGDGCGEHVDVDINGGEHVVVDNDDGEHVDVDNNGDVQYQILLLMISF